MALFFNISKNLAQSSLASSYTAGDSTITLQTGDGAKFDAPNFVIAFNSPPDFFVLVTGISGDVLTVQTTGFDGSTPVNEPVNTQITEVITFGVLQSLLLEGAGQVGPASGWTAVNMGSSSIIDGFNGRVILQLQDASSLQWRILEKSTPSTPYHVVMKIRSVQFAVNVQDAGLYFYDGTKLMGIEYLSSSSIGLVLRVQKMNSVTSDNSTAASSSTILSTVPYGLWLRIGNDGTNVTFDYSIENGSWINMFSEAVGTFITPTKFGFGGMSATSGAAPAFMVSAEALQITP